jgi:hypothetical protein
MKSKTVKNMLQRMTGRGDKPAPANPYPFSKEQSEDIVQHFIVMRGLETSINTLRDQHSKVHDQMVAKIRAIHPSLEQAEFKVSTNHTTVVNKVEIVVKQEPFAAAEQ